MHAQTRYRAYLLRLWPLRSGAGLVWRASLESPLTGERWAFVGLDALFAFLREQAGNVEGCTRDPMDTPPQAQSG
jgi:hypothetical protein